MNNFSRIMGKWLFNPYRCINCKQKMNFEDGMKVDQKLDVMVHQSCTEKK